MSRTQPSSIRRSFVWNFFGSSLYSLAQWLLLVVLARLATPQLVGSFALILAISAPVFMTAGMNLRLVQATDAVRRWRLEDYLVLRHVMNAVAVVITVTVGLIVGLAADLVAALAAVAAAKCIESVSQTYYGYFQQHERHDFVSHSMIVRSVTGPAFFVAGYLVSEHLAGACLGLLVGWSIPQQVLDRRRARRLAAAESAPIQPLLPARWGDIGALARKSSPMGLDQGMSSLSVNIPRYVVQGVLGSAQLGVYAALSYLTQAISMVTSALGVVVMPRLAQYNRDGKKREFVRLLVLQTLFGVLVVAVALLAALILGEPFIRAVLGEDYVDQELLIALLLGAAAVTLQRCVGRGLAGAQRFKSFLAIDTITAVGVATAAIVFVPSWGLVGAAWATTAGFALGTVASVVAVSRMVMTMRPEESDDQDLWPGTDG